MRAKDAKRIAKQWVDEHVAHLPGFHGAYLAGSINRTPDDEAFLPYLDVDVHVVLDRARESGQKQDSHLYHGVILESYFVDRSAYESWEMVASDPLEAQSFRSPHVLADPTGNLTAIGEAVARSFSRREWVEARCGRLRNQIVGTLNDEAKSSSMFHLVPLLASIPHLIANARVQNMTNRRTLCRTREVLQADDRMDLHESLLDLHGFAHVTPEETEVRLQECLRAFDRAVEVFKTPFWSDHRMHPYVRPYLEHGAREMIDEGCHREALAWIVWNHIVANVAIQNDAPEEEKRQFKEAYDRLYGHTNAWYGYRNPWPTQSDVAQIKRVVDDVLAYVDGAIASNPDA